MGGIYLRKKYYLLDTHALIFWSVKEFVSEEFIRFFDEQMEQGYVLVSSISFWETAILVKKGRIQISNVHEWKSGLSENTRIRIIDPTASEMIDSVLLPDCHRDPFDRLLIAQANHHHAVLVTKDEKIKDYEVEIFWI